MTGAGVGVGVATGVVGELLPHAVNKMAALIPASLFGKHVVGLCISVLHRAS
jgi:hypothetical protein